MRPRELYTSRDIMDAVMSGDAHNPTVLLFGAKWCRACKALRPFLCRMAADFPEATFLHVHHSLATESAFTNLDITKLPTLLISTSTTTQTMPFTRDSIAQLKHRIRSSVSEEFIA